MSQNDYVIANQSAPDFRADLNNALQALASLSSGITAPTTTYANMLWYDSGNNILKMRSEADDAWVSIGLLDQSTNEFVSFSRTSPTASSEGSTTNVGSFTMDADGRLLYWNGNSYKYPKGTLLKSYHIDDQTDVTVSSGSYTRHSIPFAPVSQNSNIFITYDVNLFQRPSADGNEPIVDVDLYLGSTKIAARRYEMDAIGSGSIKGSQTIGTKVRTASYSGSQDIEVVVDYVVGDIDVTVYASGLCIEEFSDG